MDFQWESPCMHMLCWDMKTCCSWREIESAIKAVKPSTLLHTDGTVSCKIYPAAAGFLFCPLIKEHFEGLCSLESVF